MSQTTSLLLPAMTSAECIEGAVANLIKKGVKCSLHKNVVPAMFYETQEQKVGVCEYVIKMEESRFDVGFKYNGQSYDMYFDAHQNEIRNVIGMEKLEDHTILQNQAGVTSQFNNEYSSLYCEMMFGDEYDVNQYVDEEENQVIYCSK